MPRVSVIISTLNGERFIREAVQSFLNQTFQDFELFVVNDGSTDATLDILRTFNDSRIRILDNGKNIGIAGSQNNALAVAGGEYLALMDHDDVSLPERLQMQVDFLDAHPQIGMIGSNCLSVDESERVQSVSSHFSDDAFLKWQLLLCGCPFFHTSLMVRRSAIEAVGAYNTDYLFAGDYDLISRLANACSVSNLEQPLVKWRVHSTSASVVNQPKLLDESIKISRQNIQAIMGSRRLDDSTWEALRGLVMNDPASATNISSEQVNNAILFLLNLQERFYQKHNFPDDVQGRHRRHLYSAWGRHFMALALRGNGNRDVTCRARLLYWAARLLLSVTTGTQIHRAAIINPGVSVSPQQPL